jgi:hypothetical protein
MVNLDVAHLRSKLDLENKYVDFSVLRTSLTVFKVVGDLEVEMTEPNKEGECRGKCPKCEKDRSFCVNADTNRFNCFAKGCGLKGGGVIDFFAKLYEVPAKDASHLLACAYGIQPYSSDEPVGETTQPARKPVENVAALPAEPKREAVKAEAVKESKLPEESLKDSQPDAQADSPTIKNPPLTAAHLIASIEHQLAELKRLLASSR